MKKSILAISLTLVATGAFAQGNGNGGSQGASNGQPFQQLQEAVDAATAASTAAIEANSAAIEANSSAVEASNAAIEANSSAVTANSSSIEANTALIGAEAASRQAADAAVAAQAAADLASEAAARISADDVLTGATAANASAISANTSALEAEEAARIAADAAAAALFAADLAAEAAARISGDAAVMEAVAAEEAARLADLQLIGDRVDVLEGFHEGASAVNYVETSNYDLSNVEQEFTELNFEPGDWISIVGYNARFRRSEGICTSSASAYNAVVAYATGGVYNPTNIQDTSGWVLRRGASNWSQIVNLDWNVTATMFNVRGQYYNLALIDRGRATTGEIYVYSYGTNNTIDINVGETREEACGF